MKNKINEIINKIYNREFLNLERKQKGCVNSYNKRTGEWNEKHFEHCEADVIAGKLDILDELKNKLNKTK